MAETAATHGFTYKSRQVDREGLVVTVLTCARADSDYLDIRAASSIGGFPSKADG